MERLFEDRRLARHRPRLAQRNGGKAGDEDDAQMRPHIVGAAREFDAIEPRHHDIGKQKVDGVLVHEAEGGFAVAVIADLMAGAAERPRQEEAEIFVVFGEENSSHDTSAKGTFGKLAAGNKRSVYDSPSLPLKSPYGRECGNSGGKRANARNPGRRPTDDSPGAGLAA